MTAHLSPLLQKARRLGIRHPADLENVARSRGLHYFVGPDRDPHRERAPIPAEDPSLFSNEELVIALIHPSSAYSFNRIRMAGAMMAAKGVSAEKLERLARQERCEAVVRHIAQCGSTAEPDNPFWLTLLDRLPETPPDCTDLLPQRSRFVAMSGLNRHGRQNTLQWIRPLA
ncbi:hypothetical protein [Haloferula sargassicola]|uniref:Uncharacterized protein n=1 Tax=Haloferula sargassicola TaxID=490096 RepID=A0ABP9UQ60_9BACT